MVFPFCMTIRIDVSEAQWAMVLIHLATAIWGQRLWRTQVYGSGLELGHILALVTIMAMFLAIIRNLSIILGKKTPLDELGVDIKRRSSNIWEPVVPIAILTAFAVISYGIGYFHVSPALFIFTFGFAFAKVTIKLVVRPLLVRCPMIFRLARLFIVLQNVNKC